MREGLVHDWMVLEKGMQELITDEQWRMWQFLVKPTGGRGSCKLLAGVGSFSSSWRYYQSKEELVMWSVGQMRQVVRGRELEKGRVRRVGREKKGKRKWISSSEIPNI